MEGGGVVVEGLGDFEALDSLVEFLFFGVEDAEAVVSGGVFLVEFEDGEQGLLGAERFVFAHGSLGGAPELFHLEIIAVALGSFGGTALDDGI